MPSPMTIKIKCEPHIITFFTRIFGKMPISLPKGHVLGYVLRHLLDRPPKDHIEIHDEGANFLEIRIPFNDEKNPLYNFYLSEQSKRIFADRIEREFKLMFREDINASRLAGLKKKDAIYLFIDKYDLSPDIFDRLIKDYQRNYHLRRYYRTKNVQKPRRKKSSV